MFTYRQLRNKLNEMPEERLDDKVEIAPPCCDSEIVLELQPVLCLDNIKLLFDDQLTRSSDDNQYHPERYVLLTDYNGFEEDGTFATDWSTGERISGAEAFKGKMHNLLAKRKKKNITKK